MLWDFLNSKQVAQLPVGVKGKVNGIPPLTPTDICAMWITRENNLVLILCAYHTSGLESLFYDLY